MSSKQQTTSRKVIILARSQVILTNSPTSAKPVLNWPYMRQEQPPKSSPSAATEFDVTTAYDWDNLTDPYDITWAIYTVRVDELKLAGMIRRAADITDEWEQDDHFDDLTTIYQQVCLEMGLPWPPLRLDDEGD